MRKLLVAVGCLLIFMVLSAAVLFWYCRLMGLKYDRDSVEYVNKIVPAILSTWDAELFSKQITREYRKVTTPEEIKATFTELSTMLGKLKRYDPATGQAVIFFTPRPLVTGDYTTEATFKDHKATITIHTLLEDNQWRIASLSVSPPEDIADNEDMARSTITRWAALAENFARSHGQYPATLDDIQTRHPFLAGISYCDKELSGYRFSCKTSAEGYEFVASPVKIYRTGRKHFRMETGERLSSYR